MVFMIPPLFCAMRHLNEIVTPNRPDRQCFATNRLFYALIPARTQVLRRTPGVRVPSWGKPHAALPTDQQSKAALRCLKASGVTPDSCRASRSQRKPPRRERARCVIYSAAAMIARDCDRSATLAGGRA